MRTEIRCAVCGELIEGPVPVILLEKGKEYLICSSLCHRRFEEDRGQFTEEGKRRRRPWFSRREG